MPLLYGITGVESASATPSCDCLAHRFGNAADHGMRGRRYPTDMSDAEWAVVRPLLPVPGWLRGRGGQPEAYCHRAMLDAIRYLVDNGTTWRAMPAEFPPWDRVYAFFRRWRDHGLVKEFHDRLRRKVREQAGRDPEPSAGVIDSQSIKADAVVATDSRGFDGGKLINGRKRHAVVDTLGLLLGVMVTAADIGDRAAGQVLLSQSPPRTTGWRWSGPTAATPAASSSTAWPPSPWSSPSSNAVMTCAASSYCPSGGSWSGSSPT
ncbi:IS5 family transposase [Streptomyces sp. RerS4]|nr:IS5 family transposase [Streptomyces sp. RerS4]UQX04700.1 IS5 family transposase [Streptomyces sp. RerS4]